MEKGILKSQNLYSIWIKKTQKNWKYSDSICVGCGVNEETGDEVISCSGFSDNKEKEENIPIKSYQLFVDGKVTKMSNVAKLMMRNLQVREKLLDGLLWWKNKLRLCLLLPSAQFFLSSSSDIVSIVFDLARI